jgi:hypothetical protein
MKRRLVTAAVLALTCLLASGSLARADYDPLGSGTTRLTLDKSFLALLKQNGVKLSAVAPARLSGATVTFPVAGGEFDPLSAKGTVEHEGALLFKAGARKLPLKALQLKTTQRRSPFSVKVGGGQLKLAQAKGMAVSRQGFGEQVKVSSISLSAKVAGRLGKKLHLRDAFTEGQPLGSTVTKAQPVTIALLGRGRAELTLDPGIAAKLASLFVAVNPIFPAEHPGPAFTLPIFGGAIAPDGSLGTLETQGALEFLQLGGGQVFWAEDWLDLGARTAAPEVNVQPSPPFAGKVGRVAVAELGLTGAAVSADPKARTVTVAGVFLTLQAATAQTFNEVFTKQTGKDGVFAAGEALGSMSFVAQGQ